MLLLQFLAVTAARSDGLPVGEFAAAESSGLLRHTLAKYGLAHVNRVAKTRAPGRASSRNHEPDVGRAETPALWPFGL